MRSRAARSLLIYLYRTKERPASNVAASIHSLKTKVTGKQDSNLSKLFYRGGQTKERARARSYFLETIHGRGDRTKHIKLAPGSAYAKTGLALRLRLRFSSRPCSEQAPVRGLLPRPLRLRYFAFGKIPVAEPKPASLQRKMSKLCLDIFLWQGRQDLNLRHPVLETGALPTELLPYE
jgi:hypothetical protein